MLKITVFLILYQSRVRPTHIKSVYGILYQVFFIIHMSVRAHIPYNWYLSWDFLRVSDLDIIVSIKNRISNKFSLDPKLAKNFRSVGPWLGKEKWNKIRDILFWLNYRSSKVIFTAWFLPILHINCQDFNFLKFSEWKWI